MADALAADTHPVRQVKGLPTLIPLKAGRPVATRAGGLPKARLRAWLDQALVSSP